MTGYLPSVPVTGSLAARSVATARTEEGVLEALALAPHQPELPLKFDAVDSAELFAALSAPAGDLVSNGRALKFLIDLRNGANDVYFVNANYQEGGVTPDAARYHYDFALAVLGIPEPLAVFNQVTYFTEPKTQYVAGVLHTYHLDGEGDPIYGVQFYPQDVVREEDVLKAVTLAVAKIPIPGARFAFVSTGSQQTTASVAPALAAANIEVLPLDRILGSIVYIPLNRGEAWGFLRIFPPSNDELTPADIPVFEELPLDLSVVAGVITRAVQDSSSHVNLKSKERGTPNMVLRDASPEHPRLLPFRDQPVHFVVAGDDFLIEPTTEEEVMRRIAERNDQPWIPLTWEQEDRLLSYDEMSAEGPAAALEARARYGSKAANLGFLAHASVLGRKDHAGSLSQALGYDLTPHGFGVPLTFYQRFIEHPPNSALRETLAALIEAEKAGTLSAAERTRRVEEVQDLFLDAEVPPDDLAAVRAKLEEVLPGVDRIKVRSSANAEDVPNFDGAGLHDSFAATVSKPDTGSGDCRFEVEDEGGGEVKRKVKPKTVSCAIKGVYASLWNKRAIEERSFARIDHVTAAMGLAILPEYDLESEVASNAVVITRVLNANGVYGYTLSIQAGNNLVTNPNTGTHSEITIAGIGLPTEPISLTVTRYAKPVAGGPERTEPVLSRDDTLLLVRIANRVEQAYCRATPGYYSGNCKLVGADEKSRCLDMEFKRLENGQFVSKQVREFGGK